MKKLKRIVLTMFIIFAIPLLASAGSFDGSAPLLCALFETFECGDVDGGLGLATIPSAH